MKLKIRIDAHTFEVELGDLNTHPIRATVDGETFEVWPEGEAQSVAPPAVGAARPPAASPAATASTPRPAAASNANAVQAPIPGVIISVAVQAGMSVSRGQELCMLEAMKMNNAIRSPRDGKIASVSATVGQAVKHGDVLVVFDA